MKAFILLVTAITFISQAGHSRTETEYEAYSLRKLRVFNTKYGAITQQFQDHPSAMNSNTSAESKSEFCYTHSRILDDAKEHLEFIRATSLPNEKRTDEKAIEIRNLRQLAEMKTKFVVEMIEHNCAPEREASAWYDVDPQAAK